MLSRVNSVTLQIFLLFLFIKFSSDTEQRSASGVVEFGSLGMFIGCTVEVSLFPFSWCFFNCLYFVANLAVRLMCLHWKLPKRSGSIFLRCCLGLWWIFGFLGYLTGFFCKVHSSLRRSNEVCLWIQRKDLNLNDVNRVFFCCCCPWTTWKIKCPVCKFPVKCTNAVGCGWHDGSGT